MNKEEVLQLAADSGARMVSHGLSTNRTMAAFVTTETLLIFANACEKIGMEKAGDMLSDALQSDLEHGVKWLNEKAAKDFSEAYPVLTKTIGEINETSTTLHRLR